MLFHEVKKDLFSVPEDYFLAHCISTDAKMGAGIALQFRKRFDLSFIDLQAKQGTLVIGDCVISGRVLNLITKTHYWNKPTYETFRAAVERMRLLTDYLKIKKVAMPRIGSGLDKLDWAENKKIIQEIYEDADIEILVCYQ